MNVPVAVPAPDKESLLMRSALLRLRLRRDTHALRNSLPWKRAAIAAAAAPAMRRMAFGIALSFVGVGRIGRALLFAGRVLLVARLARAALDAAHRLSGTAALAAAEPGPGTVRVLRSAPERRPANS
jgi:hypothetical protein